jgi:hypothetical protein
MGTLSPKEERRLLLLLFGALALSVAGAMAVIVLIAFVLGKIAEWAF